MNLLTILFVLFSSSMVLADPGQCIAAGRVADEDKVCAQYDNSSEATCSQADGWAWCMWEPTTLDSKKMAGEDVVVKKSSVCSVAGAKIDFEFSKSLLKLGTKFKGSLDEEIILESQATDKNGNTVFAGVSTTGLKKYDIVLSVMESGVSLSLTINTPGHLIETSLDSRLCY